MLVVTCWKLSGVLHEVSGFTHDYPVSLDVTSCYVTCGLVMLRMLTCACLLHQASPQQDYGVAHRFLYLVCLAALLSLQVHPAHCNSIEPQRESNSRMLLLWNCFAALQVHFMHLRSKGVPHDVGQQMHALFVSCAD